MPDFEQITLVVGGQQYAGWEETTVRAALNEAAREFTVKVSEIIPEGTTDAAASAAGDAFFGKWVFPPNTALDVNMGGSLLVRGYTDEYSPEGDGSSHHVTVTGRGKGADFADGHVVHKSGEFRNKKLEDIAAELDASGVGVKLDPNVDSGQSIRIFRVNKGSTQYKEVLRLCQQRKLVMKGMADGTILLTRAGKTRHAGGLVHGFNIKRQSGKISAKDRYSDTIAVGQSADFWDESRTSPKGTAHDPNVPRYRPKVLVDNADTDPTRLRNRAEWEQARAAGHSLTATLTTNWVRDEDGVLWEPGNLVFVQTPWLRIEQDMLIKSVEWAQSGSGTAVTIETVDPQAYAGDEASASGSDSMWNAT